ncbi:MAG: DNA-binding CsgD family transcriptional regulator [Flavobacteriales bacterium]|jgi:DNA-binding CsgD family transcriptional regulator
MSLIKSFFYRGLLLGAILLQLTSCSDNSDIDLVYSFEVSYADSIGSLDLNQIEFESFENLNLGFYEGYLWIKLEVYNTNEAQSFIIINNDLISRNYRFFKLDTTSQLPILLNRIKDTTRQDYRTNNLPNPNFQIDLSENENATYFIGLRSDGRSIDATPTIMTMEGYNEFSNEKTVWSLFFFGLMILLLLINIYQWKVLKRQIYLYYLFYMIATFIMYLGFEGYYYNFGLKHNVIDHIVFISIRIWIFSLLMYTSNFLETKLVAPRYFNFSRTFLLVVLGGATLYQLVFFETSIGKLHFFENTLSFVWLILIVITVLFSAKQRRLELVYYLVPLFCFLLFTCIGLIDGHIKWLPGDPFHYIKTGTIIEFIGFTYLISRLIKIKLRSADLLQDELLQNRKELESVSQKLEAMKSVNSFQIKMNKTDFVGMFKLLENSLSDDSSWEEFKLKFESLNPNFLNNLGKAHPNLSKSEIRLITLIKVDYSQKEIAEILNIAPDSVKKAKSRVRKKMDISSSTELKDYLFQF